MSDQSANTGGLLLDLYTLGVPALPPPLEDDDQHWLSIARRYAVLSKDPYFRSGCVLVRHGRPLAASCDTFPGAVKPSMARRRDKSCRSQMLLSAEQAAIAAAAATGASVQSSTAYIWPMPTSAAAIALLIQAGCVLIICPDFVVPARMDEDMQAIQAMAAESGVLFRRIDPEPLLEEISGTLVKGLDV